MGYKFRRNSIAALTSVVVLATLSQSALVLKAEDFEVINNVGDITPFFAEGDVSLELEAFINKYNSSDSEKMIPLPYVTQNPDMPMGCEIATLSMMFKNWGIDASKNDIWKRLKGYKKYWNYGETPSIAHAEVKRYNPKATKFSIIFPEQIVPIINEILIEKGRDDLVATAVYDYTMNDLDHSISNYNAPFAIFGGSPISAGGHVVLYLGNNVTHDPWKSYGPYRSYKRDKLEYAIKDGGKYDDGWHVKGQTYGFVILKKSDFEEWKQFGRANSPKLKFGTNYTKKQATQRNTKIKYSSKKKYKLANLYLIAAKDGNVFIAYRKKIKKKPVTYGYVPIGKTKPVYRDIQILSKEKVWKIIPKNLSSSQKKKGISYKTLLGYMTPIIEELKLELAETLQANTTYEDNGITPYNVIPEEIDVEVPEITEEEMLESIEDEVVDEVEEENPLAQVTRRTNGKYVIDISSVKGQEPLWQYLDEYYQITHYFNPKDITVKDEDKLA